MDLRKKKIVATLTFPIRGEQVLLARKTRKLLVGCWNGWGGAQEEGETIRQAALREFEAESGLTAQLEGLEYVGVVNFHNQKADGKEFDVEVHMFLLKKWTGVVKSKESEMKDPTFWPLSALPYHEMAPSDHDWLPAVLAGEWIEGEVWHGPDQKTLMRPTRLERVAKLGDVD